MSKFRAKGLMKDENIRSNTIPGETVATISHFPPYHLIVTVEFYFNFGVNESRIMPSKYIKHCFLGLPSIPKCFSFKTPLCQLSIRMHVMTAYRVALVVSISGCATS